MNLGHAIIKSGVGLGFSHLSHTPVKLVCGRVGSEVGAMAWSRPSAYASLRFHILIL